MRDLVQSSALDLSRRDGPILLPVHHLHFLTMTLPTVSYWIVIKVIFLLQLYAGVDISIAFKALLHNTFFLVLLAHVNPGREGRKGWKGTMQVRQQNYFSKDIFVVLCPVVL